MKLIKIDVNGYFLEDVIVQEIPMIEQEDGTQIQDPQFVQETPVGFYLPRYVNGKWVEGLSLEQIDALKQPSEVEPSLDERIANVKREQEAIVDALAEMLGV